MAKVIRSHRDLEVHKSAMEVSMELFKHSKKFPREEMYSLTDQLRRSSRSTTINFVEAWRKRRYEAAFVSKLSDSETEAAETQGWIEYAVRCEYLPREVGADLYRRYDKIIATLVGMIEHADKWIIVDKADRKNRTK